MTVSEKVKLSKEELSKQVEQLKEIMMEALNVPSIQVEFKVQEGRIIPGAISLEPINALEIKFEIEIPNKEVDQPKTVEIVVYIQLETIQEIVAYIRKTLDFLDFLPTKQLE